MSHCVLISLFVLLEWTPSGRKKVGILSGILPQAQEQNKYSYFTMLGEF